MGTTVVRDQPDGDIYIAFNPDARLITVGGRAEVQVALVEQFGYPMMVEVVLRQVDVCGTSAQAPGGEVPLGGWAQTLIPTEQLWRRGPIGWLRRERLVNFAHALAAGDDEAAAALLEPDAPKDTP